VSSREERRRLAYRWLREGVPKAEIARRLGVAWRTVWAWEKRRAAEGPTSWREHRHPGPDRRLSAEQLERVQRILRKGARSSGYPTDLWTLKRVAEVIEREYGVEYTLSGVWRVLRALGLSAQVPLKVALERNEPYIQNWVRVVWPALAKRALERDATIVFVDETGVQTTPNVRRSWAKVGERLVLRSPAHHEKLSVISGVTADGELFFEIHEHDITGTEVVWFLEQLLEEIEGRVLVMWDNGGIHRCVEVQTFVWENRERLELRRLPPYAPELNPDEGIWDVIKNDRLANYCPRSLGELREKLTRQLERLKDDPGAVQTAMSQIVLPWELAGRAVRIRPTVTLSAQA
jgi:transposase